MKKCFLTLMSLLFVSGLITACSENGPDNNGDNTDIEEVVPGTNHKILIAYRQAGSLWTEISTAASSMWLP